MYEIELAYNKAFNLNDLQTCIHIAKNCQNFKVDLQKLSEAVVNSKNPLFCINYVKWLKPKDKKPFEEVILNSKNAHIACIYALDNKDDCDLSKFEELILENGDAYDCVDYVCGISTEKLDEFKQKIIDEEEAYACYLYCLKFQPFGKDLKQMQEIVYDSDDMQTIYMFARDIYNADVLKLSEVAFDFGSSEDKINFACLVALKNKEFYEYMFGEIDDGKAIPEFIAKNLQKSTELVIRFEDDIIEYGLLDDVKDFFLKVPFANYEKLQGVIEKSNRKDLKLDIAMSPYCNLQSINKSICDDIKKERML